MRPIFTLIEDFHPDMDKEICRSFVRSGVGPVWPVSISKAAGVGVEV